METLKVIEPMSRSEKNKAKAESIEIESADYKNFNKEELIKIIEDKDRAYSNLETVMNNKEEAHNSTVKNLCTTYDETISQLKRLVEYYKNKLDVIKGIIDLEGGEK